MNLKLFLIIIALCCLAASVQAIDHKGESSVDLPECQSCISSQFQPGLVILTAMTLLKILQHVSCASRELVRSSVMKFASQADEENCME